MAKEGSKSRSKGPILWIVALLLATAAGVGATLMLTGQFTPASALTTDGESTDSTSPPPPSPKDAKAMYLDLDPPFVINYDNQGELRYLQLSVSAMARSDDTLQTVEAHLPRIRNSLILLFGSLDFNTLGTKEGKEELRESALKTVREIIREEASVPDVEAIYFTSFVMQ